MPVKAKTKTRRHSPVPEQHLTVDKYLARDPEIDCRIIDAAASLFRQHGFANVRMQDVGDAVGLSKAGLYHHCPSKEELLADIVRLCGELLTIQLRSVQDFQRISRRKAQTFGCLAHGDDFGPPGFLHSNLARASVHQPR